MHSNKEYKNKMACISAAVLVLFVALFINAFITTTAMSADICYGVCCGSADGPECQTDPPPPFTPVTINLEKIYNVLKDRVYQDALINKIRPALGQLTASVVGAGAGIVEASARMTQALVDYDYKLAVAGMNAEFAANKMRTVAGDALTCNAITANQLESLAKIYSDVLSDYLSRNAYDFSFGKVDPNPLPANVTADKTKGPKCRGPLAGHGPQALCTADIPSHEMVLAQCFLGTYDPLDYPDEDDVKGYCGNTKLGEGSLVTGEGSKTPFDEMVRADKRMDTIFGKLKFVSAKSDYSFYTKLFKKNNSEAGSSNQRQFLAAVNYCYNVYGFPPPRSKGRNAKEEGVSMNMAAYFDLWEAQNFPVLQKCLQIVAEHTRPDCSDSNDSMKALCTALKQGCTNAQKNGVDVSMYDCSQGLSYAEARDIAQESCLSSQEYINLGGTTTATQADVIEHARECGRRVSTYHAELKRERDEFSSMIIRRYLPPSSEDNPNDNPKFNLFGSKPSFL